MEHGEVVRKDIAYLLPLVIDHQRKTKGTAYRVLLLGHQLFNCNIYHSATAPSGYRQTGLCQLPAFLLRSITSCSLISTPSPGLFKG